MLRAVAGRGAVPYGYTVSLWSSGALVIHARGAPGVADVFLFASGALVSFLALGLVTRREADAEPSNGDLLAGGMLNVLAVGLAVGAVALIALIPSAADWALASFAATTIYLCGFALQLALVARGAS
jgi:hypothetical protein